MLLSFADQVGHQRHRLAIAAIDVVGEGGQHWAEDGLSALDLADERTELFVAAEIRGRGVDDEVQALQGRAVAVGGRLEVDAGIRRRGG